MNCSICETWEDVETYLVTSGTNLQSKDVYSIQWIPGTEVHKFNLPSDGRYDLYYKFEDGEFADIGTPALQRTETMVSHLE